MLSGTVLLKLEENILELWHWDGSEDEDFGGNGFEAWENGSELWEFEVVYILYLLS